MNDSQKPFRLDALNTIALGAIALLVVLLVLPHLNSPPAESSGDTSLEAPAPEERSLTSAGTAAVLEEEWGIRANGLRLALGGNMLDFRYTILDPAKAGLLRQEEDTACLIDEASGTKVPIASTTRAWSARRAPQQLALGGTYAFNFPNPNQRFKTGSKVTVVMGKFRAANLTVE